MDSTDPFRKRGKGEPMFNRDVECPDLFKDGEEIRFYPKETNFHTKRYPALSNTIQCIGYLSLVCLTENGRKIVVIVHSPGINKLWVLNEDENMSERDTFKHILLFCASQDIELVRKYYPRSGVISNKGLMYKKRKPGIEIYFKSSYGLIDFCKKYQDMSIKLHISRIPTVGKYAQYVMATFSQSEGMWYKADKWTRTPDSIRVSNEKTEIHVRLKDCVPLLEEEQTKLTTKMVVGGYDIEARLSEAALNNPIMLGKAYDYETMKRKLKLNPLANRKLLLEMAKDGHNVITNICVSFGCQTIPGNVTFMQGYNIAIGDTKCSWRSGFYEDDDIWVNNIIVPDMGTLLGVFCAIWSRFKVDILVGHRSYEFDNPAIAGLILMSEKYDRNVCDSPLDLLNTISLFTPSNPKELNMAISDIDKDKYKLSQTMEINPPRIRINGTVMMDSMVQSIKYLRANSMFMSLNNASKKFKIKQKHDMSHFILKMVYDLLLEAPVDNGIDQMELHKRVSNIMNFIIDESKINNKLDILERTTKLKNDLDNNLITPIDVYESLIEMTWKYCFHDANMVLQIQAKLKPALSLYYECRALCLRNSDILMGGMYTLVNQLMEYTSNLRNCMNTVTDLEHYKKDKNFTNTFGGMMYFNPETQVWTHKIRICTDLASAYPNGMAFGSSPCSVFFTLPNWPGVFLVVYVPSKDTKLIKTCYIEANNTTELGQLARRLLVLRDSYKKAMLKATDPITKAIYDVIQNTYKTIANSMYGIISLMAKTDPIYHAVANIITHNSAFSLTQAMTLLLENQDIKSLNDVVYGHTDSIAFEGNISRFLPDIPEDDAVEYCNYLKENFVEVKKVVYGMVDRINDGFKKNAGGASTMSMGADHIMGPSIFFAQRIYAFIKMDACGPKDVYEMSDIIIKGLPCGSDMVSDLVKDVGRGSILAVLNAINRGIKGQDTPEVKRYKARKRRQETEEIVNHYKDCVEENADYMTINELEKTINRIKDENIAESMFPDQYDYDIDGDETLYTVMMQFLRNYLQTMDLTNSKLFQTIKKFKTTVSNKQLNDIVAFHNVAVSRGMDSPQILESQQITIINVLLKNKYKLNGTKHTNNSRGKWVTIDMKEFFGYEININHYMTTIIADLLSLAKALGYDKKVVKSAILALLHEDMPEFDAKTKEFVKWFPLLNHKLFPDGEDYCGLGKFIAYGSSGGLDTYSMKYICKLAEKARNVIANHNIDTNKITISWDKRSKNTLYKKVMVEVKELSKDIQDICVLISNIGHHHIEQIYEEYNVHGFINEAHEIIKNNRVKIDNFNKKCKLLCSLLTMARF